MRREKQDEETTFHERTKQLQMRSRKKKGYRERKGERGDVTGQVFVFK